MSRVQTLDPRNVDFAHIDEAFTPPDVVNFSQPKSTPDFASLCPGQVKTLALPEYRGRSVATVARRVFDAYAEDFYVPGLEFRDWLVEHYDSAPESVRRALAPLTDGNWHHFFGSAVRRSDGRWLVPYVKRDASDWKRNANWLGSDWNSDDRVVLLEI